MTSKPTWIKWCKQLGVCPEFVTVDIAVSPGDRPRAWILPSGVFKYFDGTSTVILSDIADFDHSVVDHTGLPGVGGGIEGSLLMRIPIPLSSYRIQSTGVSLTSATAPKLELNGAGDRARINWVGGDITPIISEDVLPARMMGIFAGNGEAGVEIKYYIRVSKPTDTGLAAMAAALEFETVPPPQFFSGLAGAIIMTTEMTFMLSRLSKSVVPSSEFTDVFDFKVRPSFLFAHTDDVHVFATWLEVTIQSPNL